MLAREGEADLGLPSVLLDLQGAVPHEGVGLLQCYGELEPLAGGARSQRLQLLYHGGCLPLGARLPGLVSGNLGIVAVGQERRQVRVCEATQDQALRLETSEPCRAHLAPFRYLHAFANAGRTALSSFSRERLRNSSARGISGLDPDLDHLAPYA